MTDASTTTPLHQRYRIEERIDFGGMAEVFRGTATSIEGFERIVAIKRVLPNLTRKRKFIRMFMDEARLALQLTHANIVPVFDVGVVDDAYFIVMEYVQGVNLRDVLEECFRHRAPVPVAVAVYIAAEVCKGLAYAHEKADAKGEPLAIVHRDISPPNILLSVQGEVKIADFGLAKAKSQLEHTDPGLVKGKFGYLSPEAAYGEYIDSRTDIFAVGILLWEMLAADRLFIAETEPQTLDLVRRAMIPPLRERNPAVPEQVEATLRRALARDKTRRYQTAEALGNDLTHLLFDHGLRVTSSDVAALVELVRDASGLNRTEAKHSDERLIETMIQDEIDRLIPLDDLPFDDGTSGETNLEDPSKWFDVASDFGSQEAQSQPIAATRIGPTASPESLLIPIHVVQEAAAEAIREGRLSVQAADREGSGPSTTVAPGANTDSRDRTDEVTSPPTENRRASSAPEAASTTPEANPSPVPSSPVPSNPQQGARSRALRTAVNPPSGPIAFPAIVGPVDQPNTDTRGRLVVTTVLVIAVLLTLGAIALALLH